MIKIGVSSCFLYPDMDRVVFGPKTLVYLENDMSQYLSRPGVMPILIPDYKGDRMKEFLDEMDGFVFQGGADLAPESYGEEPIGRWKGDKYRDEYELALMDYAVKSGKPVFGICRGFQVMNAYFGGTLYQDLETQRPDTIKHRDAIVYDRVNHEVVLTQGELLDKMYAGVEAPRVNSVHHQGVKDLGKDLKVLATSKDDGIIEAFTWTGAPDGKVMAVQWHPEYFHTIKDQLIDAHKVYDHFLSFIETK